MAETIEGLKAELARARELLKQKTHIALLKDARPGDMAFLTPPVGTTRTDIEHLRESLHGFHGATGVKVAVVPAGFSVEAQKAATCIYTAADDDPLPSGVTLYNTGCGKRWNLSPGLDLYPFCAWCGKPVQEE